MNVFGKMISILQICLLTTFHVEGKPCSNSSSECQHVRIPLVSNKLNAPLVAELDVTAMNKQLKTYIRDDIETKFQHSQDANNKIFNDLANDLKSRFDDLSQEFKDEFLNNTKNLQTQKQELEEWKTNVMATLNDTKHIIKYKDCSNMKETETKPSGVYTIYPDEINGTQAYCGMSTDGGGWTVIQRRIDGTTSFDRRWVDYREGFGCPQKEYWLGNKYLNIHITNGKYELRINRDINNKMTYALYKTFIVSDENSQYKLTIWGHSGTANDRMNYNNGMRFTTRDRDHDTNSSGNCAKKFGGWWYGHCSHVFLNRNLKKNERYWLGLEYIKSTMMIRRIM